MSLFGLGVAGLALEQAIPFGRVWSFPTEIVISDFPGYVKIYAEAVRKYQREFIKLGEDPKYNELHRQHFRLLRTMSMQN